MHIYSGDLFGHGAQVRRAAQLEKAGVEVMMDWVADRCMFDDDVLKRCSNDPHYAVVLARWLARRILGHDVNFLYAVGQLRLYMRGGKEVIPDLVGRATNSDIYLFDFQKELSEAKFERLEWYGTAAQGEFATKGMKLSNAPKVHVTFITPKPMFQGSAEPVVRVHAVAGPDSDTDCLAGWSKDAVSSQNIIKRYVDGSCREGEVGKALHDLFCPEVDKIEDEVMRALVCAVKGPDKKGASKIVASVYAMQHLEAGEETNARIVAAETRASKEAEKAKSEARGRQKAETALMQAKTELEEKDATIEEKDAAIEEKDAAIEEKDAALEKRDAALAQMKKLMDPRALAALDPETLDVLASIH